MLRLLDTRTNGGETALMKAAEAGGLDVVLLLLREGADPWQVANRGQNRTASWYARVHHPMGDVHKLLEQYMAEMT